MTEKNELMKNLVRLDKGPWRSFNSLCVISRRREPPSGGTRREGEAATVAGSQPSRQGSKYSPVQSLRGLCMVRACIQGGQNEGAHAVCGAVCRRCPYSRHKRGCVCRPRHYVQDTSVSLQEANARKPTSTLFLCAHLLHLVDPKSPFPVVAQDQ